MQKKIIIVCYALAFVSCTAATWAMEPTRDRSVSERVIAKMGLRKAGKLIVSPNGMRVAFYVGVGSFRDEDGERIWQKYAVVVDGKEGVPHDGVGLPFFSPDSKRVAYTTRNNNESSIVVIEPDGKQHVKKIRDTRYTTGFKFSPDSKRVVYVNSNISPDGKRVARGGSDHPSSNYYVVDGKKGKRYEYISGGKFSPDSKRFAYRAVNQKRGQEAFVVVDGREGKRYYGTENYLTFSPDSKRLLYVALIGSAGNWNRSVVVDSKDNSCRFLFFISCGKEGKHYSARGIYNPKFSPDSKRVVYVVDDSHVRFVVLDGKEGKRYSGKRLSLYYAHFSPDSKRIAYPVRIENDWWFVVDNKKEGKRYKWVGYIAFSPDSSRLAYVAREGGQYFVVVNGKESNRYDRVSDLVFSPDSKTLAYAAYSRKDKKWQVVVNGKEGRRYDLVVTSSSHRLIGFGSTGSLRFISSDKLHYLAVQDKGTILLVKEKLK